MCMRVVVELKACVGAREARMCMRVVVDLRACEGARDWCAHARESARLGHMAPLLFSTPVPRRRVRLFGARRRGLWDGGRGGSSHRALGFPAAGTVPAVVSEFVRSTRLVLVSEFVALDSFRILFSLRSCRFG